MGYRRSGRNEGIDVREFKQHVRELAEERWERDEEFNKEKNIFFGYRGRQITSIAIDWKEASPETIKRKKFNELHPRSEKGRFIKK